MFRHCLLGVWLLVGSACGLTLSLNANGSSADRPDGSTADGDANADDAASDARDPDAGVEDGSVDSSPEIDVGPEDTGVIEVDAQPVDGAVPCTDHSMCADLNPDTAPCAIYLCSSAGVCFDSDEDGDGLGLSCDCDNSNSDIGQFAERACTDNPTMICQAPAQSEVCIDGSWSGCQGGRGSTADVCNGLDDDCDGNIDETVLPLACGQLQCVDGAVVGGQIDPGPEQCGNGAGNNVDDDCDGVVDEGCIGDGCIWVNHEVGEDNADGTRPTTAKRTLVAALAALANSDAPPRICLMARRDCGRELYGFDDAAQPALGNLPAGVEIRGVGAFVDTGALRECSADRVVIVPEHARGVVYRSTPNLGRGGRTALVNLTVEMPVDDFTSTGVTVGSNVRLDMENVIVQSAGSSAPEEAVALLVEPGGAATAVDLQVDPGEAEVRGDGIVNQGYLVLLGSRRPSSCDAASSIRGGAAGYAVANLGGEVLVNRAALCSHPHGDGALHVVGGEGHVHEGFVRSAVGEGRGGNVYGAHFEGCILGAIVNSTVSMAGGPEATASTWGIRAVGECPLGIVGSTVKGLASRAATAAHAVSCEGASCTLLGSDIEGVSAAGIVGGSQTGYGLWCEAGGCPFVAGNTITGSRSLRVERALAVTLINGGSVFAGNEIVGGCSETSVIAFKLDGGGGSRLQNNTILAQGQCNVGANDGLALELINDPLVDINGNTIDAGYVPDRNCRGVGVLITGTSQRALLRNNILGGGQGCSNRVGLMLDAGGRPAIFSHNGLTHGTPMLDGTRALTTAAEIDALGPRFRSTVVAAAPGFVRYPSSVAIGLTSPFAGAGTLIGAPERDQPPGLPTLDLTSGTLRAPDGVSMGALEP